MDIYGWRRAGSSVCAYVWDCVCMCCCIPPWMHLSIGSESKGRAKWDAFELKLLTGWPHGNTAMSLFESESILSHLGKVWVSRNKTTMDKTMQIWSYYLDNCQVNLWFCLLCLKHRGKSLFKHNKPEHFPTKTWNKPPKIPSSNCTTCEKKHPLSKRRVGLELHCNYWPAPSRLKAYANHIEGKYLFCGRKWLRKADHWALTKNTLSPKTLETSPQQKTNTQYFNTGICEGIDSENINKTAYHVFKKT